MLKKSVLKSMREVFETETGHDCRLTDDAISAIVENIGNEAFNEMEPEEQIALFVKAEDAFKGIAISDPGISGLVAKLDAPFYAELDSCVEAIIKGKQSVIDMLGQFKRVWSKVQFDACPYPGSDKDDVKGTNYAPDIVEKKAVAGGTIRTVFTDDLVYAMPKGKQAQLDMDDATAELKVSGSIARFKNKGKQALRDILNSAKQERDGMRKVVRGAIQLHHKLSAIDGMPLVKWSWLPGTNDKCPVVPKNYGGKEVIKVTRGPKPLWLEAVDSDGNVVPGSGKEFSAAQVIAFNPAKALAMPDHGTLGDLIDSAKGEPETPATLGEKMSVEEMDTLAVVFNAKLANTVERAALRTRMLQPDNETARASYCALFVQLQGFYKANQAWYDDFLDRQTKGDAKDAALKVAV